MNEGCEKCSNLTDEIEPLTNGVLLTGGQQDNTILKAQVWMIDNGDGPCLDFWTTNAIDDTLTDEYIPISFCPFCGRKLRDG